MSDEETGTSTKKKAAVGGSAVALIAALTGAYTAFHGTHSTTTANSQAPVVVNRPHDANGSPLPVTVQKLPNGAPLVIVGATPPSCFYKGDLPDSHCTPGATDPRVTQGTIQQTICTPGYTKTVRTVPATIRTRVLEEYGWEPPSSFHGEVDHLISLELGGSNDIKNLWPQEGKIPNAKDTVENRLHSEVCAGQITLTEAQREIRTDWRKAK